MRSFIFVAVVGAAFGAHADPSLTPTEAATASTTQAMPAATTQPEATAAQSAPPQPEGTTRAWPLAIDFHFVAGVEPHSVGSPVSFGTGLELLYRARVGFFGGLIASNGSKIVVQNAAHPGLPDRISIPFGVAARPFAPLVKSTNHRWWARLVEGIGADAGLSIEILHTSDDSTTTVGFHFAGFVDVPLYGGPRTGGVALRIMGRGLFAKALRFESDGSIATPAATGQLLFGLAVAL